MREHSRCSINIDWLNEREHNHLSSLPVLSYVMGRAPHSRDADGPRELRGVANIRSQNGLLGITLRDTGLSGWDRRGPATTWLLRPSHKECG